MSKAQVHQLVSKNNSVFQAQHAVAAVEQARNVLFRHRLVDQIKRQTFRNDVPEHATTWRGISQEFALNFVAIFIDSDFQHAHFNASVDLHCLVSQSTCHFVVVGENHAFAFTIHTITRDVVKTEHHVLRRHNDRLTVGRRQNVVCRHHQCARFKLSFNSQRHVHSHLVTVEVGVECRTYQRMQLDGFTFNQDRLKRLQAETVKCRCAVKHDGMFANHVGENIPNFWSFTLNHFLRGFNRCRQALGLELAENERLE